MTLRPRSPDSHFTDVAAPLERELNTLVTNASYLLCKDDDGFPVSQSEVPTELHPELDV